MTQTKKILNVLGCTEASCAVVFVSDRKIKELNRDFRFINKATDVLSFAVQEGDMPIIDENELGDVIISVETAARQAKEIGHSFNDEITRLLIHGMLHLNGFDHQNVKDSRSMKAKERSILKKITK